MSDLKTAANDFTVDLGEIIDAYRQSFSPDTAFGCAMAYALKHRGKMVRPQLVHLSNQALGGSRQQALLPAMAVELVHTYSLVHDDLPCMDNDTLRRGQLTVHAKFDEATALLVGDALLTDALTLLTQETWYGVSNDLSYQQQSKLVSCLGNASSGRGMVLGQALDLHWTGQAQPDQGQLDLIHLNKTGRLLGAACALGAITAGNFTAIEAFQAFGEKIGLAFQIIDDCLDDSPGTGKSAGKDQQQGKLTYLTFMDKQSAWQRAQAITADALTDLAPFGQDTRPLTNYAQQLLERQK